jgi:hypothetical protein
MNYDLGNAMSRTVIVDGKAYEVSTDTFTIGEWAAAQYKGGLYVQGEVTRIATGVVTIKEEGTSGSGRRPHITVPVECVYVRHPPGYRSSTAPASN